MRLDIPFFSRRAGVGNTTDISGEKPDGDQLTSAVAGTDARGSVSDAETIGELELAYQSADTARRKFEPVVFGNYALYAGRAYDGFASDISRYRNMPIAPVGGGKGRMSSNQILPYVRQATSICAGAIPKQRAIAKTAKKADIESARLATDYIEARWYDDDEATLRFNEILNLMTGGRVLRRTYWDPDAGREGLRGNGETPGEGDIVTEYLDFWHYLLPPWTDCLTWPPDWVIQADVYDCDQINDMFPGKKVGPEGLAYSWALVDRLLVQVIGGKELRATPTRQNAAVLKQMFMKPTRHYPNGRYYIWANDVLLRETDLPGGKDIFFPLERVDWFPVPSRLYPMSMIECLEPLQRQYNGIISQWVEINARKLRGDHIVIGERPEEIIDKDTGVKTLVFAPGSDMKFFPYDIDTSLSQVQLEQIVVDMRNIVGIHPPTQGIRQGKTTLGETQLLQQADMQGFDSVIKGCARSYASVDFMKVRLMADNAVNQRELSIPTEELAPKTSKFYGKHLQGVKGIIPSSIPNLTPIQIEEKRTQLAETKCWGPYGDPAHGISVAEDMLAKQTIARASGIPGIEDEMDKLGVPYEDLVAACASIYAVKVRMEVLQANMQIQLATDPQALLNAALKAGAKLPMPGSPGGPGQPALPPGQGAPPGPPQGQPGPQMAMA